MSIDPGGPKRHALGVDFGTSNTVAVARWPDGRARPILVDGSPLLPSAVYAEPDGHAGRRPGRGAQRPARSGPVRAQPEAPHRRRRGAARRPRGAGGRPGRRGAGAGGRGVASRGRPGAAGRHADLPGDLGRRPPHAAGRGGGAGRPGRVPGWSPSRSPRPPTSPRCSAGTCRSGRSWWCTTSAPARSTRAWSPAPRTGSRCWRSTGGTTSAGWTSTRRSSITCVPARRPATARRGRRLTEPTTVDDRRAQRQLWDDVRSPRSGCPAPSPPTWSCRCSTPRST